MSYFTTVVKYNRVQETGVVKPVKEHYLFEALSFTEAEARTVEELSPYISGDFSVEAVKKARISEIFTGESEADRWYKVKVAFITIDEKTATEKRTACAMLANADSFADAYQLFVAGMKGTMADYEIISIAETPILDFFPAKKAE